MSKPEQPFAPANLPPTKKAAATKRVADPELQALSKIGEIFKGLDEAARERVLDWLSSRYRTWGPKHPPEMPMGPVSPVDDEEQN